MPELPEVETTAKGLRKTILGLVIKDVWTDLYTKDKRQQSAIANPKYFVIFKKDILNKKVLAIKRRGKNILINLSNGKSRLRPRYAKATPGEQGFGEPKKTILIHLKMTGHLLYGKYKFIKKENKWLPDEEGPLHDPFNKYVHVVFTFSNNKHLAFSDARKFGKITLLNRATMHDSKHLSNIGPEPLEKNFNLEKFKECLNKKLNGKIKTVLIDQSIIAGIGNIYSDEILWRAGINPERRVLKIKEKEIKLMFRAMKKILLKGIDFGGDSMSDYRNIHGLPGKFQIHHETYRRTGKKCRKKNCKGIIKRKAINGRSAHFCSVHQK